MLDFNTGDQNPSENTFVTRGDLDSHSGFSYLCEGRFYTVLDD